MLAAGPEGLSQLQAIFPESWDTLEVSAMSLGFEDVTTAIDLCANAAYLATGGTPSADGSFKDLGYWSEQRIAALPNATGAWLGALLTNPDTQTLRACRQSLSHRTLVRHIAIQVGSSQGRSLAEITTPGTPGGSPPKSLGSIGILIPRLIAFGEREFISCCEALTSDFKP
jgi:hypothetical protein